MKKNNYFADKAIIIYCMRPPAVVPMGGVLEQGNSVVPATPAHALEALKHHDLYWDNIENGHPLPDTDLILLSGDYTTKIRVGFKSKNQLSWVLVWREYIYKGRTFHAKVLWEFWPGKERFLREMDRR